MKAPVSENRNRDVPGEVVEPLTSWPPKGEAAPVVKGLARVERKRSELLLITALVVMALLVGFLAAAFSAEMPRPGLPGFLTLPEALRAGLALLVILFLAYVVLAEKRNRTLTRSLWNQRMQVKALGRRLEELQALQEVSTAINAKEYFRPTVDLVIESVFKLTGARYVSLMMASTVIHRSREGFEPDPEFVDMVRAVASCVQEEGKAMLLRPGTSYRPADTPRSWGPSALAKCSLLSIPLNAGDKTMGAFNVVPPDDDVAFESEEKHLLRIFADQVTIAILKGQLVQRLEDNLGKLHDAQEMVIQTAKLAAIGELTAGVAHEINNPLGGILGITQHLLERVRRNDVDYGWMTRRLEMVEREAKRGEQIMRDLLNFSRFSPPEFQPVELNAVLNDVLGMLEHQLSLDNISIERNIPDFLPTVMGNANQLQQVFINILINARKAIGKNGTITITGTTSSADSIDGRGRDTVQLALKDTGCGISGDKLRHIFESFFTTRKIGEGTGLGLPVSYRIIKNHEGDILVESTPGKGSTFTVQLPVAKCARANAVGALTETEDAK